MKENTYIIDYDPETGEGQLITEPIQYAFISEDQQFAVGEFFMILGFLPCQKPNIFFALLDDSNGEEKYPENDISAIVTMIDNTNIEFTCFGKIQFDEKFFDLFSPINVKNPDIEIQINGMSISASDPREIIDRKWSLLEKTPISFMKLRDEDEWLIFNPNPNSHSYPAENSFMVNLKSLNEAYKELKSTF